MSSQVLPFQKPHLLDRLFNRVFGVLVSLGFGFKHTYLLEVRGRKSGKLYTMPVDLLTHRGRQYLVAPRGYTQWVRNAQAAGVTVSIRAAGCRSSGSGGSPKPSVHRPEGYLAQFSREVQRFFPVPAGAPVEAFVPLAPRYPAFELLPNA